MKCPGCGYIYWYEGISYKVERCPICGYYADFMTFVTYEEDRNDKKD
jgi:hypothetical protein